MRMQIYAHCLPSDAGHGHLAGAPTRCPCAGRLAQQVSVYTDEVSAWMKANRL